MNREGTQDGRNERGIRNQALEEDRKSNAKQAARERTYKQQKSCQTRIRKQFYKHQNKIINKKDENPNLSF